LDDHSDFIDKDLRI